MIAKYFVGIMVFYLPINNYGYTEVVANIQGLKELMSALFLYTTEHNNILTTNMLSYLVIENL